MRRLMWRWPAVAPLVGSATPIGDCFQRRNSYAQVSERFPGNPAIANAQYLALFSWMEFN